MDRSLHRALCQSDTQCDSVMQFRLSTAPQGTQPLGWAQDGPEQLDPNDIGRRTQLPAQRPTGRPGGRARAAYRRAHVVTCGSHKVTLGSHRVTRGSRQPSRHAQQQQPGEERLHAVVDAELDGDGPRRPRCAHPHPGVEAKQPLVPPPAGSHPLARPPSTGCWARRHSATTPPAGKPRQWEFGPRRSDTEWMTAGGQAGASRGDGFSWAGQSLCVP